MTMPGSSRSLGKRKQTLPSYLLHQASGQARMIIGGRTIYLGEYGSEESRRRYGDVIAEHSSGVRVDPFAKKGGGNRGTNCGSTAAPESLPTISELVLAFMRHSKGQAMTPTVMLVTLMTLFIGSILNAADFHNVTCDGTYPHHLQGICADKEAIYWCFTTTLVKTDLDGKVLMKVPVANHHGDLCIHDGKLFVAVNLGKFNDQKGNADSWVYVYNAADLSSVLKHETKEVFHGAGGIGFREGHFFVVGGLPDGVEENYVYEYDGNFKFLKKHVIKSGHTHLGIQTATFANDRWWFGCYGSPQILLVTDADFKLIGRHEYDCSLGIVGLPDGRFLSASGKCEKEKGCAGNVRLAVSEEKTGLLIAVGRQNALSNEK